MFTSYDKAIVALIVPLLVQLLVHFGLPNSDQTTTYVTDVVTGVLTLIAVYWTPNKGITYTGLAKAQDVVPSKTSKRPPTP